MEQIRRVSLPEWDLSCFIWCLGLPVGAFLITLSLMAAAGTASAGAKLTIEGLRQFAAYYNENMVREFLEIFLNNMLAAIVLVYFTPLSLGLRSCWSKWKKNLGALSAFEKCLLYLFPVLFLIRQAVNIAMALVSFSGQIDESIFLTLAGIILPHGVPELLVFSLAGAIGMEITRKCLSPTRAGRLPHFGALGLLAVSVALCAFTEVYFTPKVFALLMATVGLS